MQVGDVVKIDDSVTGFDRNKPGRPCMVVGIDPPPRRTVFVVPRTTSGTVGTFVPARALRGLDRDGRFLFLPRRVSQSDLVGAPNLGQLPEPYRTRVLEQVNVAAVDVEFGP